MPSRQVSCCWHAKQQVTSGVWRWVSYIHQMSLGVVRWRRRERCSFAVPTQGWGTGIGSSSLRQIAIRSQKVVPLPPGPLGSRGSTGPHVRGTVGPHLFTGITHVMLRWNVNKTWKTYSIVVHTGCPVDTWKPVTYPIYCSSAAKFLVYVIEG